MKIPHENIYYMLLYAWNRLEEGSVLDVGAEKSPGLVELFARVLNAGVNHILRRGLDRGYVQIVEPVSGLRGRVRFNETLLGNHLGQGRTVCEYDQLTYDILHNRIVKSTLARLLTMDALDAESRHETAATLCRLADVPTVPLSSHTFRAVQLHSNNAFYGLLIEVCRFLHDQLLPMEAGKGALFRDFFRDEREMRLLFQAFVRNFYATHARTYRVKAEQLRWTKTSGFPADMELLPVMITDVTLISSGRKIVIETKYTPTMLQGYRGREAFRSEHLYQLFAYLQNTKADVVPGVRVEGVLLYPAVGEPIRTSYEMHGCRVRINSVCLDQQWQGIHDDLMELVA